ncbi:DUF302 domain-containing protein [Dyella flava]|uniref:DUF302 domain-containing protein n=1 Tax=Dyella flava TaxID=1920170 RepID=A0ABS2K914_9GAMM|nr:DUF302 domain-containing protein [Dyella flava]MBM7127698.1 DUF302 domain-containing protein [Dyella flava]GLQ51297.1 hypothetical protein GCM10010872_27460 [Dyella flava]
MTSSLVRTDESAGIVTLQSPYAFADTVQRLLGTLADHQIKIFATIDQRAEAIAAGLSMPPTTLILFGNPKAGTPVMLASLASGIDLPLKALVVEPEPGRVEVVMNATAYLIQRHALPQALAANLLPAERLIAAVLHG